MAGLFETILEGLGLILGIEVIVFVMFSFSFLVMLYSRGLGITALITTFVFTAWVFTQDLLEDISYLSIDYYIIIIIVFGMFLGYLVHNFIRK